MLYVCASTKVAYKILLDADTIAKSITSTNNITQADLGSLWNIYTSKISTVYCYENTKVNYQMDKVDTKLVPEQEAVILLYVENTLNLLGIKFALSL